jgi:leucyl aminopeptidase
VIVEFDGERLPQIEAGVAAGQALALGVNAARDYVSEPPNVLFPAEFARRAEAMAAEVGLQCTVLGEKKMRELGMNILLAVSKGSKHAAKLIILEHTPERQTQETSEEAPLVLVGKGVTFDTGGISIKPAENMWRMKSDMGGAAAVVGAMESIARLKLPRRVIGLAVCVENMPDGKAFRPGDIWTGITGKSAEIISTDAEGRLILADALGYVAQYNPKAVVDLATLTGAIGVALGSQAAGLFANDNALQEALLAAAKASGERLWPMPMYDEYKDEIKSDMAEVKNSAARTSGVAASAKFIEHFTEGYPWAHLDIASMVWDQSDGNPLSPKGATGYGVRLLVELTKAY